MAEVRRWWRGRVGAGLRTDTDLGFYTGIRHVLAANGERMRGYTDLRLEDVHLFHVLHSVRTGEPIMTIGRTFCQ